MNSTTLNLAAAEMTRPALRASSTRREFLARSFAILAGAAVTPLGMAALPDSGADDFEMKDISLDDLRFATFARHAKTPFLVHADDKTVELQLTKAKQTLDTPTKGKRAGDAGN